MELFLRSKQPTNLLHVWTRTSVSTGVLCFSTVIALSLAFPGLDSTIILLIVDLIFLGMPHGAMDIFLGYRILKKAIKIKYFVATYLAVSAVIVALWIISPTASFLFFIAYSLFHFADSDLQKPILESKLSTF